MDLGVYKTKDTPISPISSSLARSEISYEIARACSSKGSLAGEAGREVIQGLVGDSDAWEEAARAIIEIEGIQGEGDQGEEDDEAALDILAGLGENQVAIIDKLALEFQGFCR